VAEEELRPEDVEIIHEYTYSVWPTPEEEKRKTAIVYRYKDELVGTVVLDGEAPSDEEVWEAIKADIIARRRRRPRKLKVGGTRE